ncbi:type II toxin-antitoxin system RatA family toxin [Pseudolysobacter antarcticus]|uniref:Type II toxin-antitoxin system RatA family toxin n=1 Tax=Pseudolysobacter antarcticus TaxID=2511995 RepID=A0A411HJG3_9GAMM|nr:type II toxin-antitoxin system RatA family toxin [Pseudolysobacter antarcticus]QBB70633.1 type II toxin-antitoxin system RatA family toxin [Pseudolysobacter antarcticus]
MIKIRRSALVRYSAEQMFDLVNDVQAYPKRFSWSAGAQVLASDEQSLTARLELRMVGLTQAFTTRNVLERPERITMNLVEGPFRQLTGIWTFSALGTQGCKVALSLDFEFSGRLLGSALRLGFQGIADRLVDDFCSEAARIYA